MKKNFKKYLSIFLIVVITILSLTACGSNKSKLIGTWETDYTQIEFVKDGSVIMDDDVYGTWTLADDVLVIKDEDDYTETYKISIEGKEMILIDQSDGEAFVAHKK